MKITLDIPDDIICAMFTGMKVTTAGFQRVYYSLDKEDLHDGAEIKLPLEEREQ